MGRNERGLVGCGCLVFLVVVLIVCTGILIHPYTLRFVGGRFYYSDRVVPGDAIFVPRFPEDRNGELFLDAFREYWAGNGKAIYIEDDRIMGYSVRDLVARIAKDRGIKEESIKKIEAEGEGADRASAARRKLASLKAGRVIVLVPEYAGTRYHLLFGSSPTGTTQFLIKAANLSYFKKDQWWKDDRSRNLLLGEIYGVISFWIERFKHGVGDDSNKG